MNTHSSATFVSSRNERCNSLAVFRVPEILILGIFILGLESCHVPSYPKDVHQKADELALVGYNNEGVQSAYRTFFVRNISMHLHIVMAGLGRDTSGCAGFLRYQSTNPFRSCHPHLVVNGKTPINNEGAH